VIVKSFDLKKKLENEINFFLLYGTNNFLIEKTINNFFKPKFSKNLYSYDENEILENHNRFLEDLLNESFFEHDRLIIINRGTDKIKNIIEELLEKNIKDLTIVIKSELLEKKSKLRNFFEKSNKLIITPFYEDDYQTLLNLAQNFFRENKIKISTQSINYILEITKGNRMILTNELKKIKNFSQNKLSIELDDLIKITNSAENYKISELTDQCLARNKSKTINILNQNNSSVEENILILKSFLFKLKRLKKIKEEIKKNKNHDQVISSFKPPIFWKDKDMIKKQLINMSSKDIKVLIKKVNDLELLIKKNSSVSNEITNNFVFETIKSTNNLF
jgi:DNA polymerase-3 subunit delta